MKKRLIISNLLILLVSLICMLVCCNIIANKTIESNARNEITNYLNIATNIYDGSNAQETASTITKNNKEIRITFIDSSSYKVIYDSEYIDSLENHSNRPELNDLGQVYIRDSKTMNVKMMYIASLDDNVFIRVSIPLSNLDSLKKEYIIYTLIIWIIIAIISTFTTILLNKASLKPINKELNKLVSMVDSSSAIVDINELPNQVEKTRNLIESKLKTITREKEKLNYFINSINQGFIVVDNKMDIYLINDNAIKIFYEEALDIIGKNFIYLCNDEYIIQDIKKALESKSSFSSEHQIQKKNYLITFNFMFDIWNGKESQPGVSIIIMDMKNINQVEMMKKDFFSNASHELKSPLTTIIGNLQLISQGIVNDEKELNELIIKSEKEAKRMAKIITEMLELSYLETGEKSDIQKIECTSIINSVLEKLDFHIKEKNIKIHLDLEEYYININLSDIQYLISNIIDNAIKYNKKDGTITISLKNGIFKVKDTGIGISSNDLERIFERFYRVDKSRSKELGGTGLGLSIVKHVCNKYHFDLKVDSILNIGSTFTIDFNTL